MERVLVHGFRMLVNPEADVVARCLVEQGAWEPFETWTVLDEIAPGDRIVDLGANIDYYTLLFARAVGAKRHVFAFEPDPASFALLERNLRANGIRNVTAERRARAIGPGRAASTGRPRTRPTRRRERSSSDAST